MMIKALELSPSGRSCCNNSWLMIELAVKTNSFVIVGTERGEKITKVEGRSRDIEARPDQAARPWY